MTRQAYGNTAMGHVWIWNEEEEKGIARAEIMAEHRMECGGEPCDWCDAKGGDEGPGVKGSVAMFPNPRSANSLSEGCGEDGCEVCNGFTPSTDR